MIPSSRLRVTKIQKFCTHDGPGVRTTVFLKGCPLRCRWCHNPETQSAARQFFFNANLCVGCGRCANVCDHGGHLLGDEGHQVNRDGCVGCMACCGVCPAGALEECGQEMTVDSVLGVVLQDRAFYGKDGGLTISGGEPMAQPEGVLTLLKAAKDEGLHTAMETCGYFDAKWLDSLSPLVDVFLYDVKDTNAMRHLEYTGVSNERIFENLLALDARGSATILRCIMVKNVNLEESHLDCLARIYHSLSRCRGVELLPYHSFGSSKALSLGNENPAREDWVPSRSDLQWARSFLRKRGVKCK